MFYWSALSRPNIHTYPQPDFEANLFAYFAIACIVCAIGSLVMGLVIKDDKRRKVERLAPRQPATVEFPYRLFDLHFAEVDWKAYAQDYRPLPDEALLIVGPICACSTEMKESHKKSSEYVWYCTNCQFSAVKQESAVATLEVVQKLAQQKLKEELERKWEGRQILIDDGNLETERQA